MFLWSKLVAIASTIITSGTASSFLVPYFKGQNLTEWWSSIIYKKDSSKGQFNFEQLDKESNGRIAELEKWFKKLSASEAIANAWKRIEFAKIHKLFEKLAKAEGELIELFKKISSSLSSLMTKNKRVFDISLQKLEEEKKEKLQQNMKSNYALFQKALTEWESYLSQITCAIDAKGQESQDENCKKPSNLISTVINSAFSFFNLFTSNSSVNTNGQASGSSPVGGGQKAQQDLEAVKQSLLAEIKKLREKNIVYKLKQANATTQEIAASLKYVYYSSLLNVLNSQQESLRTSMQEDNKSANEKIRNINNYSRYLTGHHKQYTSLQKQEAIFHNWKEIFNERILINESNKNREVTLVRNKKQ